MEKLLLIQVKGTEASQIGRLADNKKIRVITVEKNQYGFSLGELAEGVKGNHPLTKEEELPPESLMVFCQVSEKHLDKLLFEMRSKGISVDYKAVLTETNRSWSIPRLMQELAKERKRFE